MRSVTRSAAWRRVRPEMSSTILLSFGSAGGGGAGVDDDSAAVARHRDGPANADGLRVFDEHAEKTQKSPLATDRGARHDLENARRAEEHRVWVRVRTAMTEQRRMHADRHWNRGTERRDWTQDTGERGASTASLDTENG